MKEPEPAEALPKTNSHGTAPTPFSLTHRWQEAVDAWRAYLHTPPGGGRSGKLELTLPRRQPRPDGTTALTLVIDPAPTTEEQGKLATEEGLQEFLHAAGNLASATKEVIPLLKRFDKTSETAVIVRIATELAKALKTRPALPSLGDHEVTWRVQRHIEHIQSQIWGGALPPDEDLRERRAFWDHELSELRTREGHRRFSIAVEQLLSADRIPDRELMLLNAFSAERHSERLLLEREPIRWAKGTDCVSVCRRWRALVAFGLRHFSHRGHRPDGQEAICFKVVLQARALAGQRKGPVPFELEWANLLRNTTEDLRPLATAAGFDAGARIPISRMVQQVDDILNGEPIDLRDAVADVQALAEEILAQAQASPRAVLDRFHQLVIDLLGGIERVLKLVSAPSHGHDLKLLDHYVTTTETGNHSPGPGKLDDVEWQWLTATLLAHRREATELWHREVGEPARNLRDEFVLAGCGNAVIGSLRDSNFHGLVLAVAGIVLVPESVPDLHPDVLDKIVPGREGKLPPGDVRRRIVVQMLKAPWPEKTVPELECEHARVLGRCRDGVPPRPPRAVTLVSPSRGAVPPASTKEVQFGSKVKRQRPKPEAIDALARATFMDALKAAKDAGEAYFPSRGDIAKAVSKGLNFEIGVRSLFATRETAKGRDHRYPNFIELWKKAQASGKAARPTSSRPVAGRRSRHE